MRKECVKNGGFKKRNYRFGNRRRNGCSIEFCKREDLIKNPTTTMKGYGSHDVPKGSWSDDTSMTIATIDAIIATLLPKIF